MMPYDDLESYLEDHFHQSHTGPHAVADTGTAMADLQEVRRTFARLEARLWHMTGLQIYFATLH